MLDMGGNLQYNSLQMVPIRFPSIYERVTPFRRQKQIEQELNRRTGYPEEGRIAPARRVNPDEGRSGTAWERTEKRGTRESNVGQLNRPLVRR